MVIVVVTQDNYTYPGSFWKVEEWIKFSVKFTGYV